MRKTLLALTALLGLLVASASPAAAITGNYVKDFEHPYVGLLTTFDAQAAQDWIRSVIGDEEFAQIDIVTI